MRRLWAHILLAFATVATVCGSFTAVFSNARGNVEYMDGREVTFKLSSFDDSELSEEKAKERMENATKVFETRLGVAGVSKYTIKTAGNDIVKISFAQQTATDYTNVVGYLSSYGKKTLSNKLNTASLTLADITTGKTYIETVESINPVVTIPVDMDKTSGEHSLKKFKELTEGDEGNATTEKEGEGESAKEKKVYYMYLWYDYKEGRDSFDKTESGKEEYDQAVAARLSPFKFNLGDIKTDDTTIKIYVKVDQNGDGTATADEIANAYKMAHAYSNLLNAEALDYKVDCIANETKYIATSEVENLVNYGKVAWSNTLKATLIAIAIISLLLMAFYRLGALSIACITLLTTFSAAALIVAFGAEFTTAGILGVLLVSIASLTSGIIYMTKLKEDAYRGHTLKKANAEASKKSLLPIVDIHIVTIVMGIMLYLIGGSLFRTFAVATVIGGLVSLVLNTLGLKGMMWLATNTTGLIGKYNAFGIEEDKVPNHLAEEKQNYYGPFADKDFTKKKKPVAIVGGALFAASLAGMIAFGVLTKGYLFNTGNKALNESAQVLNQTTEIYLEERKTDEKATYKINDSVINDIVNDLLVYEKDKETSKLAKFSTIVKNRSGEETLHTTIEFTTLSDVDKEEEKNITTYHKYTVIELTKYIDVENFLVVSQSEPELPPMTVTTAFSLGLASSFPAEIEQTMFVDTKPVSQYVAKNQPAWSLVMLGTFAALGVSCIYLCCRYRLSRGLTSLIIPVVSCGIAVGFFSLLRIVTSTYAVASLPIIAAFTTFISIIFMNKERELVLDDRNRDNSFENRNQIMRRANSLAYGPIIISSIMVLYLIINFFGFGPKATSTYYLMALIGVSLSILFVTTLYGPISQLFYKLFSKIKVERKPKKNKPNKVVKKSSEPEEATFIGIND